MIRPDDILDEGKLTRGRLEGLLDMTARNRPDILVAAGVGEDLDLVLADADALLEEN